MNTTVKPLNEIGVTLELTPVNDTQKKCERCWHRRDDVGQAHKYPTLCSRCIHNLPEESGEIRYYA